MEPLTANSSAKEVVERFWHIQNAGDYTKVVPLFAEDAVLVDPFLGTFEGREATAGFMAKMVQEMVQEMGDQQTSFTLREVDGGGEAAWAQRMAHTSPGDIEGCGLYRVRNGEMTYYKDYMNAAGVSADNVKS
jgi:steroid delta-isomerase